MGSISFDIPDGAGMRKRNQAYNKLPQSEFKATDESSGSSSSTLNCILFSLLVLGLIANGLGLAANIRLNHQKSHHHHHHHAQHEFSESDDANDDVSDTVSSNTINANALKSIEADITALFTSHAAIEDQLNELPLTASSNMCNGFELSGANTRRIQEISSSHHNTAVHVDESSIDTFARNAGIGYSGVSIASTSLLAIPPSLSNRLLGWWVHTGEVLEDSQNYMEFYNNSGSISLRFYGGTREFPRENIMTEWNFHGYALAPFSHPVTYAGPDAVAFPSLGFYSSAGPTGATQTTFTLMPDDIAYFATYDEPGATGYVDLAEYSYVGTSEPANMQRQTSMIAPRNWNDPREMFQYAAQWMRESNAPQATFSSETYIGDKEFAKLIKSFLHSTIVRIAHVSPERRLGGSGQPTAEGYIGVWPGPRTTIHTATFHQFQDTDRVTVTGFTGSYKILNGIWDVSIVAGASLPRQTPYWHASTVRPFVTLMVNSTSLLSEPYNPCIHGNATLKVKRERISLDTEYRDLVSSLLDFMHTAFGESTHTRFNYYKYNADTYSQIPSTFAQLQAGLLTLPNTVSKTFSRSRFYMDSGSGSAFYANPRFGCRPLTLGCFNDQDPFGLGGSVTTSNPTFNYYLDMQNYMSTKFSVYWAITGPFNASQPLITSQLTGKGYANNGNTIVFTTAPFAGAWPSSFTDAYGTHAWHIHGGGKQTDSATSLGNARTYGLAGGIINSSLTNDGEIIAYIRIGQENGFDQQRQGILFYYIPSVFGNFSVKLPFTSLEKAAFATLMAQLKQYNPTKFIIDNRGNTGGFIHNSVAYASFFGDDRICALGDTYEAREYPSKAAIRSKDDVGYVGAYGDGPSWDDGLQCNPTQTELDFPGMTVSGTPSNPVQLTILTNLGAASGGDTLLHNFIGPENDRRNIGNNVHTRIVGDAYGIGLGWGGFTDTSIPPVPGNPILKNSANVSISPFSFRGEVSGSQSDISGKVYCNFTDNLAAPDVLLPGWYDATYWQDLGYVQESSYFPFSLGSLKAIPVPTIPSTWRDSWLEWVIVND